MSKLKYSIRIIFICWLILLWACSSYALTIEDIANPRKTYGGWVTDNASILNHTTESQLNQEISQLKSSKGIELAVVTVLNTSPASSTKSFASQLFNYWGIGNKKENNGILFLVSVQDHRVEIETGTGIEKIISNSKINQIIEEEIKPRFREKKFDLGILAVTSRLIAEFDDYNPVQCNTFFRYIQAFLVLGLFPLAGFALNVLDKIKSQKLYSFDQSLIHKAAKRKKHYFEDSSYDGFNCGSSDVGGGNDFGGGESDGGGAGSDW